MKFVQPIRDKEKIEQIKEILRNQSERNYMLFYIGINTGLRISDILSLKVGDFRYPDLSMKTYLQIKEGKTKKNKDFKIYPHLKKELEEYCRSKKDHEYLIQSRCGKNQHLKRHRAYKILRKAAKEVGLNNIGTHTLRKTFGYHFYQETKDIAALMDILNHSEQRITMRYIGVNQDVLDKALKNFKL